MAKKNKIKNANTNGFDKNPQNINRSGANRKTVSTVVLELRKKGAEAVTGKQIIDLFESLFNCSEKELKEIITDKEQPMLNRIVAKQMLDKKGFDIIEKMLDRAHGKAIAKQEIETNLTLKDQLENIERIEFVDEV
jgi:hypothetical protein